MMRRSRLSLFYLSSYLALTGLGLMFAPDLILKLLFSNRQYDDIFPRFAGVLMVAIAILVAQTIRHRVEALYPTSLVARSVIWLFVLWLYFHSGDPFFMVVLAVVGLGMVLTSVSYYRDRRAS